jgi:hypothetical protein
LDEILIIRQRQAGGPPMLDEPRGLPRRVNQCKCHLLTENNEIIREPETRLARM